VSKSSPQAATAAERIDVTTQDVLNNQPASGQPIDGLTRVITTVRSGTSAGRLGLIVIGGGLLVIGLGWNGMAGAGGEVNGVPNLNAQLPWLVSGGILGLALVVFGAALLIAHNARADRVQLEEKLTELVDTVARLTALSPAVPAQATRRKAGEFRASANTYHRSDCRLVEGRDDLASVTKKEADSRGLKACRICKPA